MQKSNNEVVESVLMAIPADLLEEVGIDLYSTIQMSVSRGRIIIEPVDEEESTFHQRCPHACCCEGCQRRRYIGLLAMRGGLPFPTPSGRR